MMWIGIILVIVIIMLLAILGGMGFFGDTSDPGQTRKGGGNNFIDWMF
jgi:hypothetical protein